MKEYYRRFRNWANETQGVFSLVALGVAAYAVFQTQNLSVNASNSLFQNAIALFVYRLQIPIYLLAIGALALLLYTLYLKRRCSTRRIGKRLLAGNLENQWGTPPNVGTELLRITEDGSYFIGGRHEFDIEDVTYDPVRLQIQFVKVARNDPRRLSNVLTIENTALLVGSEDHIPIRYTRLP